MWKFNEFLTRSKIFQKTFRASSTRVLEGGRSVAFKDKRTPDRGSGLESENSMERSRQRCASMPNGDGAASSSLALSRARSERHQSPTLEPINRWLHVSRCGGTRRGRHRGMAHRIRSPRVSSRIIYFMYSDSWPLLMCRRLPGVGIFTFQSPRWSGQLFWFMHWSVFWESLTSFLFRFLIRTSYISMTEVEILTT